MHWRRARNKSMDEPVRSNMHTFVIRALAPMHDRMWIHMSTQTDLHIYDIYMYIHNTYAQREREREGERERDRGIDIERERPTDRNFLSSLCLLCSLAGLAALPARLLCWLRLAVLACLLACLLLACQMVCISTHTFPRFFYTTPV